MAEVINKYRLALKVPVFVKVALSCRVSPSLYPPPVWLIVPELVIDTVDKIDNLEEPSE